MAEPKKQAVYYIAFFVTNYRDIEEARTRAPDIIGAHLARSKKLHAEGTLLMAGAFLDNLDQHLSTMAVLTSREAAEDYARGDPFAQRGMVAKWYIREWANMLA